MSELSTQLEGTEMSRGQTWGRAISSLTKLAGGEEGKGIARQRNGKNKGSEAGVSPESTSRTIAGEAGARHPPHTPLTSEHRRLPSSLPHPLLLLPGEAGGISAEAGQAGQGQAGADSREGRLANDLKVGGRRAIWEMSDSPECWGQGEVRPSPKPAASWLWGHNATLRRLPRQETRIGGPPAPSGGCERPGGHAEGLSTRSASTLRTHYQPGYLHEGGRATVGAFHLVQT